jgi:imipenem/basic amino acid-specific outer membrane pore
MKKTAIISLSAILATQLMGAEDLSEMMKEGKFGGYVRIHHILPDFSDTVAATGSVIGGKLKYQTGALYGVRFGAAMYTTHDTGLTKEDYKTRDGYSQVAQGLHGDDMEDYTTLGEAYVSYRFSNTDLTYGRQEFKTPMTENAVTIIPNLFEGTVATIKEIPDFTVTAAHITKMQYGTRAATDAALIGDGVYAITSGAGFGFVSPAVNGTTGVVTPGMGKSEFQDMAEATFGRTGTGGLSGPARMDTAGVTSIGIDYKKGNLQARIWDYYAHEMYNTIYADAEYKLNAGPAKVSLGAQLLTQSDLSDFATSAGGSFLKNEREVTHPNRTKLYKTKLSEDGQIDAMVWGLQAKASIDSWGFNAAYTDSTDGHVINAWGGDPLYTGSIFTRNNYRADTSAYKVGGEYDFSNLGIKGLKFSINHAEYDSNIKTTAISLNGTSYVAGAGSHTEKSSETDYMLHYVVPSVKGLWFRLFHVERDNDTRNYEQSHTRLIANLSF